MNHFYFSECPKWIILSDLAFCEYFKFSFQRTAYSICWSYSHVNHKDIHKTILNVSVEYNSKNLHTISLIPFYYSIGACMNKSMRVCH